LAGADRTAPHAVALTAALAQRPWAFDFYQALRLLECAFPEHPRLGRSARAAEDPVRLGQAPDLAFAPASLAGFTPGGEDEVARLSVLFFGLFGPNGPLPLHLTEYARERLRHKPSDATFARFADVFHHRMLSLFYRAWADARPAVNFDRPRTDRYAVYVGATFGMGLRSLRERDAVSDLTKLHYAGTLACQTRHAEGLEGMLSDFFKIPVAIEQFVGRWIDLPRHGCWRLGESAETGTLGRTATVGARVWDRQQEFRIVAGPLSLADYRSLLPDHEPLARLAALVRGYVGDELAWKLNLVLQREEKPPLVLGGTGQLGWTTWLANRPMENDARDLLLDPLARGFAHE
jgi:type VI secretion system protein ImpH